MNNKEFAQKLKDVALNYKTLYVMGAFGVPLTQANKDRWIGEQSYNRRSDRLPKIKAATADTFGFDCVCLVKAILWGWKGDKNHKYGGVAYASNNVPDIHVNELIKKCTNVSTDFSNIKVGEFLWMDGHCGIYIGDGLAVESTPSWKDGVQITAVNKAKNGYNTRVWTKHGELPYITYEKETNDKITIDLPVLRRGSNNESVAVVQRLLNSEGAKLVVDRGFGVLTEAEFKKWQKKHGLEDDGVCGIKSWTELLK